MEGFSKINLSMQGFEVDAARRKISAPNPAWSLKESTLNQVEQRLKKAVNNFWEFDKIYFAPELYSDIFSQPVEFHKNIAGLWENYGVNIVLGPRKHGKTATLKKLLAWLILTGKIKFAATLSATLTTSRNMLDDVLRILQDERITFDFKPEIIEANADQITLRTKLNPKLRRIIALSEGRSARGATFGFERPQFILCDDLETRQSSLGNEQRINRIKVLQETAMSMSKAGSLVVLGNNFDERCALNLLKIEQEEGILPQNWRVFVYKAWDNKALWHTRFKVKSETELKHALGVADEGEWQGDFQQNPTPPDGFIFARENLEFYDNLPSDSRGVLYCDPNLSKKGKGDSTAIVSLMYSAKENLYFVDNIVCRSFSDSNKLLDNILSVKNDRHRAVGFDGHVSQESTWTNNVRNYCKLYDTPFPHIEYCRFNVDDLAKNVQAIWGSGRIKINSTLSGSPDTNTFLAQLFAFSGKKANRADDAPDALICAFELLHKRKIVKRKSATNVTIIQDYYF